MALERCTGDKIELKPASKLPIISLPPGECASGCLTAASEVYALAWDFSVLPGKKKIIGVSLHIVLLSYILSLSFARMLELKPQGYAIITWWWMA